MKGQLHHRAYSVADTTGNHIRIHGVMKWCPAMDTTLGNRRPFYSNQSIRAVLGPDTNACRPQGEGLRHHGLAECEQQYLSVLSRWNVAAR